MSTAHLPLSADDLARVRAGERLELPEEGAAVISLEDLKAELGIEWCRTG